MIGEIGDLFENKLQREILCSERLRAAILVGLFMAALVFWIIIAVAFPDVLDHIIGGRLDLIIVFVFISSLALFELVVFLLIQRAIRTEKSIPIFTRYLNAFIEATIPSAMLIIYAQSMEPSIPLLSPWVLVYFVIIMLSALRLDFWLCYFTGAVVAVEYTVFALILIGRSDAASMDPLLAEPLLHVTRGIIFLSTGLTTGFVTREIKKRVYSSLRAVQERNRVLGIFGQHVSPVVVDKLLDQTTDTSGETRHVCIMFLDIRDFTTFAETKKPQEVIAYLNRLFDFMIEIVNLNHGVIIKFSGDGFMAVFGAPLPDDHPCQKAILTSLEILEKVREECLRGAIPETRLSIGIHFGDAVMGNVGSAIRKQYTVHGDVVNTASRIEQLNREYGSQLLISSDVWQAVRGETRDGAFLGEVHVKGREMPIDIYKLA
jgi:adenylate cyclase